MTSESAQYVLVVDDEMENLDLIRRTCFGRWNVHACLNPREGVKFAQDHKLAAVVSDFRMPEMNGDTFIDTILEMDPTVGCILITAFGDLSEVQDLVKTKRVARLLMKPWEVDDFLRGVEQATQITKMRRSVGSMRGSVKQ